MKRLCTIPKSLALLHLLLFLWAQAPLHWVHKTFATHQDEWVCTDHLPSTTCAHTQPIHCGFDGLVVPALFLGKAALSFSLPLVENIRAVNSQPPPTLPRLFGTHNDSRGPPAFPVM